MHALNIKPVVESSSAAEVGAKKGPLLDIKPRLKEIKTLPPMPAMAQRIIRLSSDVNANIKDLAAIVELDPSLSAQIMRYASSPLFAYRGKIDSVQTAISRVLGFNMVMNLALGMTTAKPFRIPKNLPLGLDNFWRHAVYSAALTQALSNALDSSIRPEAGLAYLAGLLHNFGHLVFGHLFRNEFILLNKFLLQHEGRPIAEVEHEVLGIDHAQIGAWLLKSWRLPEEVVVATREHHNEYYHGPSSVMVSLVRVSDFVLKKQGIGDGSDVMPVTAVHELGLGEYQINAITSQLFGSGQESLDNMVRQLVG
ncbi:MAG: HDOD domain-containing protein [Gammaproteobacteria bacterium]|nr:HDOD domain-containing protein [Gammaproteobacteria bacterium]